MHYPLHSFDNTKLESHQYTGKDYGTFTKLKSENTEFFIANTFSFYRGPFQDDLGQVKTEQKVKCSLTIHWPITYKTICYLVQSSFIKCCMILTEVLVPEPMLYIWDNDHATRETNLLVANIILLTNFISLATRWVYKFQI